MQEIKFHDSEPEIREKNKQATSDLLDLLIKHHGQEEIKAADELQIALLERLIVPIDADQEDAETINICILPVKTVHTVEGIKRVVCRQYGLSHSEMISDRREKKIVHPRQIAMFLCRELTTLSMPRIGQRFGDKDHTTVFHAIHKVKSMIANDPDVNNEVSELRAQLA